MEDVDLTMKQIIAYCQEVEAREPMRFRTDGVSEAELSAHGSGSGPLSLRRGTRLAATQLAAMGYLQRAVRYSESLPRLFKVTTSP
jgi:hypothetical protein